MAGNACEHGVVKKSLVPTSLIFKKKRYHGCLICISGIVSERYTDPSRKLPRYSSDFLGFIKFRSTGERNFCANLLMVLKHLEETDLLSAEGRQRVLMRVMRAFSMATIEAGSTNIPREGATTDAAVDKLDASRVLLEQRVNCKHTNGGPTQCSRRAHGLLEPLRNKIKIEPNKHNA